MSEIKERSCFIHVDVPGHADNSGPLGEKWVLNHNRILIEKFINENCFICSFTFPTLQTLGEDLVTVLDYLHVKYVIGLGEGAG